MTQQHGCATRTTSISCSLPSQITKDGLTHSDFVDRRMTNHEPPGGTHATKKRGNGNAIVTRSRRQTMSRNAMNGGAGLVAVRIPRGLLRLAVVVAAFAVPPAIAMSVGMAVASELTCDKPEVRAEARRRDA